LSSDAKAGLLPLHRRADTRCFASSHIFRRVFRLILVAMVVSACSFPKAQAQSKVDEYRVKAAFLFHFAQLVEWPDAAEANANPLLLCTLGDDPFHGELESTVEGKQVGSRVLRIRHLNEAQATHDCNMVFISRSENKHLPTILASLKKSPVLTIGEADDFLVSGGIIRFCLEGNKVRFEINREAAESAKLRISAKLLILARSIAGGSGGQ
jgi:hypothetical protein